MYHFHFTRPPHIYVDFFGSHSLIFEAKNPRVYHFFFFLRNYHDFRNTYTIPKTETAKKPIFLTKILSCAAQLQYYYWNMYSVQCFVLPDGSRGDYRLRVGEGLSNPDPDRQHEKANQERPRPEPWDTQGHLLRHL